MQTFNVDNAAFCHEDENAGPVAVNDARGEECRGCAQARRSMHRMAQHDARGIVTTAELARLVLAGVVCLAGSVAIALLTL